VCNWSITETPVFNGSLEELFMLGASFFVLVVQYKLESQLSILFVVGVLFLSFIPSRFGLCEGSLIAGSCGDTNEAASGCSNCFTALVLSRWVVGIWKRSKLTAASMASCISSLINVTSTFLSRPGKCCESVPSCN
jgi:hypothetical protein